jgi:hypothetical protein
MTRSLVSIAVIIVCIGLGIALAVVDHNQQCIESRTGYCPPDRTIVIKGPINNATAVGI